jgi:hypothetical protein
MSDQRKFWIGEAVAQENQGHAASARILTTVLPRATAFTLQQRRSAPKMGAPIFAFRLKVWLEL